MYAKTILVVDDDLDEHEIVREAIKEVDPDVRLFTTTDGHMALDLLENPGFYTDLILLDLDMPVINGKECLKAIRSIDRLSIIPVVIYTGSRSEEDLVEAWQLGADFYLNKPRSYSELQNALSSILSEDDVEGSEILKAFN